MQRLLLFRRANKILEIDGNTYHFIDVYSDETDEILHHTSYSKKNKIGLTDGLYFEGVQNDILMYYKQNNEHKIEYKGKVYSISENQLTFDCKQLNEKEWVFECISVNNEFRFIYEPYVYDPYDDDDETDVNFGLWLMSVVAGHVSD